MKSIIGYLKRIYFMYKVKEEIARHVPRDTRHRDTCIEALYIILSSGEPVAPENVYSFIANFAKTEQLTVSGLVQLFSYEIDEGIRNGINESTQLDVIRSRL